MVNFEKLKLGDLASINTGLVVKRKQAEVVNESTRRYKMLTLKSFEPNGWLKSAKLEDFKSNAKLDEKYLTQEGDVIIRISHPNTAIVIGKAQTGLLIPSLFIVIRLGTEILLPEYLGIFLNNSDLVKRLYSREAIGSAIHIIKTSMIKDISVKFPELKQQQKVVKLHRLIRKEKELLLKLVQEKQLYHKEIIKKMI